MRCISPCMPSSSPLVWGPDALASMCRMLSIYKRFSNSDPPCFSFRTWWRGMGIHSRSVLIWACHVWTWPPVQHLDGVLGDGLAKRSPSRYEAGGDVLIRYQPAPVVQLLVVDVPHGVWTGPLSEAGFCIILCTPFTLRIWYDMSEAIVNCADYGVSQTWERAVVVGPRGGYNRPAGLDIRIAPAGDFSCYMGRLKPWTPRPGGSRQRVWG